MNHSDIKPDGTKRQAARLGAEYLLRYLTVFRDATGKDLMSSLILLAVLHANVAYLDDAPATFSVAADGPPPDNLRRPVSVNALAASLGIPYENARRAVGRLEREGMLVRIKGGVIVPAEVLVSSGMDDALSSNWQNVRRLVNRIERTEVGAELAKERDKALVR